MAARIAREAGLLGYRNDGVTRLLEAPLSKVTGLTFVTLPNEAIAKLSHEHGSGGSYSRTHNPMSI